LSDLSPMRLVGSEPPASTDRPQIPLARRPDFDLGGTRVCPSRLLLDGPSVTVPIERRVMELLLASLTPTALSSAVTTSWNASGLAWWWATARPTASRMYVGGAPG